MDQPNSYPFQLLDVRLYEATIERSEPDEPLDAEDVTHLPLTVDTSVVKNPARHVSVFLTLEVKGPVEQSPEFRLRFVLQGLFETRVDLEEIEQELWQEFEDLSAISLLWPYARECMHNFAHRMREDLPVLPTLHGLSMGASG